MKQELIAARMPVREKPCIATVLYRDRKPVELYIEPETCPYRLGDVYLGKIEKIEAAIPAAFVLFGPGQRGYLPLQEAGECKAGDEVAVQIITEQQKTKLPRLSRILSLTGQYVVVSEDKAGFLFSRKICIKRAYQQ